ncbi:hypothetical protein [Streptomyces sp. BPTC-684]|uniref:DUF6939 family protein n=1 Tax=Streptomyces sp. BPTC-684 TaxID=3043734 RepID=UPI0024B0FB30|nr:hypothetical protein [Streptomyces sp. BPTC-684]WHM37877.1 hypothetical protein QIY60_13815 [Streptomyces sp. BPTC-684]
MTGTTAAVSRASGLTTTRPDALRVDTAAAAPPDMRRFATMNPFHFDPTWRIPVPGLAAVSHSVESVWQALRIVDGVTDLAMLEQPAAKRPAEHLRGDGFDYARSTLSHAGTPLDLVTARYAIYLPTYLYLLDRLVPDSVLHEIRTALDAGRDVVFYDWDDNTDIEDPRSSFSHSAVLASWFGGRIEQDFLDRRRGWHPPHAAPYLSDPLPLDRYHRFHQH